MTRVEPVIEIEAVGPGVPVFHVTGYADLGGLWVTWSDTGDLVSLFHQAKLDGARVPAHRYAQWPSVDAIVAWAYPDLAPQGASR